MKELKLTDWLPTTKKEVELRGWDELDVILFSGDAYRHSEQPSSDGLSKMPDGGLLLFRNPTGMEISEISRNWDARDCFSVLPRDVWTQW